MSKIKRVLFPIGAGLAGSLFLTGLYLGLVSWAESFEHAVDYLWQDRWIVLPIILGFGMQAALYVILRWRFFEPSSSTGPAPASHAGGALTGVSGTASTIAMAACCAHHVTDVLPILGLTAAATFLAEYRTAFMVVGLGMTLVGIGVMSWMIFKERRIAIQRSSFHSILEAE